VRLIVIFLLSCSVANATDYFIDYVGGNDANNGTSKLTPWKKCPGMQGISMTYSHSAGDRFVFKGGVTWPASCFTLVKYQQSGTAGNPDTYTSDETWYSGGSFTKPVFDFEDTLVSGTGLFSGVHDGVYISDSDYVTIFGIEMKRLLVNNVADPGYNGYGLASIHIDSTSDNVTIQQCYIYNWKCQATNDSDFGGIFSEGTYVHILQNTVGWGRAANAWETNSSGTCLSGGWWCISNRFVGAFQLINSAPFEIGWNEFGPATNTAEPSAHCNGIFQTGANGLTQVIHDNLFHDLDINFQTMLLHPAGPTSGPGFGTVTNTTTILYNNTIFNCNGSHGIVLDDRQLLTDANTIRIMIWNNTIQGYGFGAVGGNATNVDYLWADIRGNHWIFDLPTTGSSTPVESSFAQTQIESSNIWHTNAEATALGYTAANLYRPTLISSPTVLAGVSLTATNVAGTDAELHPYKFDRLWVARPSSGNWDAGAYQFASSESPVASAAVTISGGVRISGGVTIR